MDKHELLDLYDQDMRIHIDYPEVRREVFSNLVRITRPAPGMNQVLYSRLDEADMDSVIEEQIAYFRQFDQPFSWHVYDHDSPPGLRKALLKHGFAPDDDPDSDMVLDLEDAAPSLLDPPDLDVRPITTLAELETVAELEQKVWGGDFAWLPRRLGPHLQVPGFLNIYAAYVLDQPACVGWVYFYPNSHFAALFGAATLLEHRGQGLYTAVLAARVQEAAKRGYPYVTTGASPMSKPILARNGFSMLTKMSACDWTGNI
jgi:GNAT superfamily N-acetyltransferase